MLKGAFVCILLGVHLLQVVDSTGHHVPLKMLFDFADYYFGKSIVMHTNAEDHFVTKAFGSQVNRNG